MSAVPSDVLHGECTGITTRKQCSNALVYCMCHYIDAFMVECSTRGLFQALARLVDAGGQGWYEKAWIHDLRITSALSMSPLRHTCYVLCVAMDHCCRPFRF